ncbi:MAG: hypothetical protein E7020_01125 [Alphaproteobacteria bacterium]|nr:hypothetical protein [Alphaproteobacteria bacterium]
MKKSMNILMQILGLGMILVATDVNAEPNKDGESAGVVLFKIHDIVPEKDANGKVLYCNVGATFFNRTKIDIANAAIALKWDDEVIGEAIDQEERAEKEQKRINSRAPRSRYSTSSFTGRTISTSLKLPQLKVNQQVTLKTKVDTDRCFLLLNDMEVTVNNCGTAGMTDKVSRQGCSNMFRYVSPKNAEYYMEFKEISPEEQLAIENAEVADVESELRNIFDDTVAIIRDITNDIVVENSSN